jgi:hypothetical protein
MPCHIMKYFIVGLTCLLGRGGLLADDNADVSSANSMLFVVKASSLLVDLSVTDDAGSLKEFVVFDLESESGQELGCVLMALKQGQPRVTYQPTEQLIVGRIRTEQFEAIRSLVAVGYEGFIQFSHGPDGVEQAEGSGERVFTVITLLHQRGGIVNPLSRIQGVRAAVVTSKTEEK